MLAFESDYLEGGSLITHTHHSKDGIALIGGRFGYGSWTRRRDSLGAGIGLVARPDDWHTGIVRHFRTLAQYEIQSDRSLCVVEDTIRSCERQRS